MALSFYLDEALRRRLGHMVADKVNEYFSSLPDRPVQLSREQRKFSFFTERIPETGEDPETVIEAVLEHLVDRGFHIPSANYLGLMNPTPSYVSVLAETLVAAFNPQLASVERSASASLIEKQTIDWIGQLIGWEKQTGGTFTSGGSEANASALNLALVQLQPDIVDRGLQALPAPAVFYASAESHHSLDKAAGSLGLGRQAMRRIPVTSRLQMDLAQLEKCIEADIEKGHLPLCIVGTAGTTNTGAIDDLPGLAEIARKFQLWFHVDGAYGAAVIFSVRHRQLVQGIEFADSFTLDPHKWLAMPFAAGMLLTRHPELLRKAYGTSAPYLNACDQLALEDNYQISSQWSRRMNSLKLWMTLKVHGRKAYEELIDTQITLADGMARWIQNSGLFELAAPQMLSAIAFRVKLPGASEKEIAEASQAVVEEVNRTGERWISMTTVAGRSAIRTMVISYLTTEEHLRQFQQALQAAAQTVLPAGTPPSVSRMSRGV